MKKRHLSSKKIKDYLLANLSTEEQINAGIHIDECRECFLKARSINENVIMLDEEMDSLGQLPRLIEKLESAKKEHLEQIDKNSLVTVIKKLLNRTDEIMRGKLEELLIKLRDPSFQMTPFSSLVHELNLETELLNKKESTIPRKEKTTSLFHSKELSIRKKAKNKIEFRVETSANNLPTIFSRTLGEKIEIVPFDKIEGTNYYSALIPEKIVDKHYLVHKTKVVKASSRKK
jgi:hypothetical protein